MSVQEVVPYSEALGNGVSKQFPLGFPCDKKESLKVKINEIEVSMEQWSLNQNTVIFVTAPESNVLIQFRRSTPAMRSTNYATYNDSLRGDVLNTDFDHIWWKLQELVLERQLSNDRLQEFLDSIVSGQINGLPAEVIARIEGDTKLSQSILDEKNRAYKSELALQNSKASKQELEYGLSPKADKVYVDQLVIDAQNNIQNFKTEVELLAFIPGVKNFTGKALDTKKVWLWDGVRWNDTGLSEKDLAIQYVDNLGVIKNINKAWSVEDATGKEAISVTEDGDFKIGDVLTVQESHQFSYVLARDSVGNVALAIDKKGNLVVGNVTHAPLNNFVWSLKDKNENTALAVDKNGRFVNFAEPKATKQHSWHKADVMFVASLGQSLSKGRNSLPIKNTTQPYLNLTFLSGELRNGTSADYSAFKPLIGEQISDVYGESPNIWHLNKLVDKQVGKGELVENWVFLGTAPQTGGTPMHGLNKGSVGYQYYIDQVQAAYELCQEQNKTFVVSHNTWTQGEDDYSLNTTKDAYKFELIQLKNDIALDVMDITKQKFRPVLITYQCPAHRTYGGNKNHNAVAQAQFEAALEDPEIILACPIYHLSFHTDNVHLTSDGSQQLGYYYAKVSENVVIKGNKWKPLQPKSINWQGSVIDIIFDVPEGYLEFDITLVAEASNYGFDIWQGETLLDIISSVSITDKDRIKITLNADAPPDAVVSYAKGRASDGAVTNSANRPRGNLRDIAGLNDSYTNTSGITTYMHNWCVMFNINRQFPN